jgi:hypothetical protein
MKRVIFGIFLIISAFVLPWWFTCLLALAGLFYFDNLYEVIAVGLIIDLLYGPWFVFYGFDLFFTLGSAFGFYFISYIKKQIFL